MDYIINPVKMGGVIKEVSDDKVKLHLHGRLGVLTVPKYIINTEETLEPGHVTEFYFSYFQVVENPLDYDYSEIRKDKEFFPSLVGGILTEVNDTAIMAQMGNNLGTVSVPRRWLFTSIPLEEGQHIEFYFSYMRVVGKKELPFSK